MEVVLKELWIEAFEQLVTEYLEANPNSSDAEAEAWAEANTQERYIDIVSSRIDQAFSAHKDSMI